MRFKQVPYAKHRKVSSLVKSHQNTHNSVKYEVISKCQITLPNMKHLRSILDISVLSQYFLRRFKVIMPSQKGCTEKMIFRTVSYLLITPRSFSIAY